MRDLTQPEAQRHPADVHRYDQNLRQMFEALKIDVNTIN